MGAPGVAQSNIFMSEKNNRTCRMMTKVRRFEGRGATMKSLGSIASQIAAAVMTFALAWLVTPAAAQHLDLDASASIMGCGTATNIGHANIAPLYVSYIRVWDHRRRGVHKYQDMCAWEQNELSGHRPRHSRYRLDRITDSVFCG
jgi:hypothetical protein